MHELPRGCNQQLIKILPGGDFPFGFFELGDEFSLMPFINFLLPSEIGITRIGVPSSHSRL
jgi:hypothetical protein